MDIQKINDAIAAIKAKLGVLVAKAESGSDWAEICRIEDEQLEPLEDERDQWIENNSQFGVGA